MTDANNSNNSNGGTITIVGSGGGGGGGTGKYITVVPGKTYTINIPAGAGGGGTCSTGGNIIWSTGTGTGACAGGAPQQISFDDIDLAVPVEEKENNSDGCNCKKCQEFFPYAEPNQDDGTLICYGCRMRW